MDDLEITKACARACGYTVKGVANEWLAFKVKDCAILASNDRGGDSIYDPLHDDEQCFALVKRFGLLLGRFEHDDGDFIWDVETTGMAKAISSKNLNYAICLCVSKLPAQQPADAAGER